MLDLVDGLLEWHASGRHFAVATVIETFASAPRPAGAAMAVSEDREVLGSISGGCVEAATVALAEDALVSGQPVRERFGIPDAGAFAVGLTCGGTIDVFVTPFSESMADLLYRVRRAARASEPSALGVIIAGAGTGTYLSLDRGRLVGTTGIPGRDRAIANALTGMLATGGHALVQVDSGAGEPATVFVHGQLPPPRMLIFGAVDFAGELSRLGKLLGYHVTVCDARPIFATAGRFPDADDVIVDWPPRFLESVADTLDERSVVCVMTHDPKFDIPLLKFALALPVAYIGAMGSRQVSTARASQLRDLGVTKRQLDRLHAPIGLDIGGATPMESAVSIAAELIAVRERRSARPLKDSHGPIHSDRRNTSIRPEPAISWE
ncbi:XdhC family protein [Nocardia sp. NPDC059246]|uniref:XdhC family protein n=1 Tax=unclassified Nocardia TaxID=2637762 RepID=UPI0036BB6D3B